VLLADVRAGKITTVVVYKVDRLTRSLTDFAKLVELFDESGVSFVSVTQSFNTTRFDIEPVCGVSKRKLKNGEQGLARHSHRSRPDIPQIAEQRRAWSRLTRRNVDGSQTAGSHIAETTLPGWACKIRTEKRRIEKWSLKAPRNFGTDRDQRPVALELSVAQNVPTAGQPR
jgi:hypothetical protein